MSKDDTHSSKKEKKEKKRKHSEVAEAGGDVSLVSERKKEKKDKKRKSTADVDGDVSMVSAPEVAVTKDESEEEKKDVKVDIPLAALVPFANPLCDDKAQKKVLKSVKKAAKHRTLKRGVKEVVKSIRKSPLSNPTTPASATPNGIVILAADISPMDVISHIPVLCEDHGMPYVYVPSRAELGAAGSTKRPTSVVMVTPKAKEGEVEEWEGTYKDLHKLAVKMGQFVKV